MYLGQQQGGSYFGPGQGGGSIPEMVMRTGTIMPFNALDARNDVRVQHVDMATQYPTGQGPAPAPAAPMAGYFGADAAPTDGPAYGALAVLGLLAGIGIWASFGR